MNIAELTIPTTRGVEIKCEDCGATAGTATLGTSANGNIAYWWGDWNMGCLADEVQAEAERGDVAYCEMCRGHDSLEDVQSLLAPYADAAGLEEADILRDVS